MEVVFTEEQQLWRKTVADFLERECPRERVRELDEKGEFPYDLLEKWAKLGWLGLPFPEEYGGSNAKIVDMLMLSEGLSRYSIEIGACFHGSAIAARDIVHVGTEEQKRRYIPKLISGELRFSVSFSEPQAGSDAANIQTMAILDGDHFVINGQKMFSGTSHVPNTIIHLAARTARGSRKQEGISSILVPNDTPGVEIVKMCSLGYRIRGICQIYYTDARVPRENLLGPLHDGWRAVMSHHGLLRLFAGAANVGASQGAVDLAVEHAKTRVQFGQPIAKFQAIAHMLVDMQTEVEAARWLVYRAGSLIDRGLPSQKEISMAKLYSSEVYVRVANNGMQVMGGYGYVMESDMQRYYREARAQTITAGTSQILRNVIAKDMGL